MNTLTKYIPFAKREPLSLWRAESAWDPFQEMERDMERMLDRMDRLTTRWPPETKGAGPVSVAWIPRVDITEDPKEYLVKAELPEVKKEEIKVQVRDHTLAISGERKIEKEDKTRKYHRVERAYGSFERSFILPEDADVAKVTSEFKDGMLNVHLPKLAGTAPHEIEVKVS